MSISKSLIEYHKMIPHPEGGYYKEVFRNKYVSHIYFLLEEKEYSHWHRIIKNELLHFYSGSPIKIFTSKDGVDYETIELGSNNLSHNINKNTWFAMKSTGAYSLIGCTVAPAFIFDDLELAPNDWKPISFHKKL